MLVDDWKLKKVNDVLRPDFVDSSALSFDLVGGGKLKKANRITATIPATVQDNDVQFARVTFSVYGLCVASFSWSSLSSGLKAF